MNNYFLIALLIFGGQLLIAAGFLETRKWSYYVMDFGFTTPMPDKVKSEINFTRVRGIGNVINGYMDINEDLTDATFIELKVGKSVPGQKEFRATPYGVPSNALSVFLNIFYKPILMEDLKECAPNAPQFEKFVAPLTKRRIELYDCVFQNTKGLPSYMGEGVYNFQYTVTGQVNLQIDIIVKIEHD